VPALRISLCLIARDEAAVIEACIRSAAGAVDEVVLVDTGSEDDTVARATALGARCASFAWVDDFSAARNETLRHATGDYVLWLDADERLAPGGAAALRAAAAAGLDCGMLPLHAVRTAGAPAEAVLSGAERDGAPTLVARFARRTPDLRWQGRVHESWRDWLQAPGRTVGRIDAHILHDGAAPEVRDPEARRVRNVGLLRMRAAEEPEDVLSRAYLAVDLYNGGQRAEARRFAREAVAILKRQAAVGRIGQPGAAVQAVTAFGWAALVDGRFAEAREAAGLLLSRGSRHPNLHWLVGVAEENRALRAGAGERAAALASARSAYEAALSVEAEVFAQQVADDARGAPLRVRLGTVRLLQGAPEVALALALEARALSPGYAPATLLQAESLIERGRHAEALTVVEPLLGPSAADAWLLAAAAALPADPATGRALLVRARALARDHLRGLHRLARLNALMQAHLA
jgi:tetratricopeptide (TPR) repeat protein